MTEADHKRALVKAIKLLGGHARRIEDSWAVGVLDLIIKLPGCPVIFAEGKVIKGNLFGPTLAQFAEGTKWIKAGVGAVLIGWQDRAMYISPWVKQADKRDCWMTHSGDEADVLLKYLKVHNAKETEHQDSSGP